MQEGVSVSQKITSIKKDNSSGQGDTSCFLVGNELKSIPVVFYLRGRGRTLACDSRPIKAQMLVRESVDGLEAVG